MKTRSTTKTTKTTAQRGKPIPYTLTDPIAAADSIARQHGRDPFAVASALGVPVRVEAGAFADGEYVARTREIILDARLAPDQARSVLAHELGHHVHRTGAPPLGWEGLEEEWADVFADALVLDEELEAVVCGAPVASWLQRTPSGAFVGRGSIVDACEGRAVARSGPRSDVRGEIVWRGRMTAVAVTPEGDVLVGSPRSTCRFVFQLRGVAAQKGVA